jgi:ribonuclease HI
MELLGVITALEALKEPCKVDLYTDSQYIVNAVNEGWVDSWQKRGWRRKDGPVKNLDLWQRLVLLLETHEATLHWVKGHADNEHNNRCDELAVTERGSLPEKEQSAGCGRYIYISKEACRYEIYVYAQQHQRAGSGQEHRFL